MEKICEKIKKIGNIIRYIFAVIFILGGLTYIQESVIAGIFMILFAISLMPTIYEKYNLKKYKYIQIILPVLLFTITIIVAPKTQDIEKTKDQATSSNVEVTQSENNTIDDTIINISSIEIKEKDISINMSENKSIELSILPINSSNIKDIEFKCDDNNILEFKKDEEKSKDNIIFGKIIAKTEGKTNIYVTCGENIKSNIVTVTVEGNNTQNISNINTNTNTTTKTNIMNSTNTSVKSGTGTSTSKSTTSTTSTITTKSVAPQSSTEDNSQTVYITPTGKRYHFDPDCGGKNSYSTTLNKAISEGYTPCQKCTK